MDSAALGPVFGCLEPAMRGRLIARARWRRFRSRESLFHEGEPGGSVFAILHGRVALRRVVSGTIVPIGVRIGGEPVGLPSVLAHGTRSVDAITATDVEIVVLHGDDVRVCLRASAEFAYLVCCCLAQLHRRDMEEAARSRLPSVRARIAATLLDLADIIGAEDTGSGKRLRSALTQTEIADRAHTTRQSANHELAELSRAGAIDNSKGWVTLQDLPLLRKLAGGGRLHG